MLEVNGAEIMKLLVRYLICHPSMTHLDVRRVSILGLREPDTELFLLPLYSGSKNESILHNTSQII
jgi:hypothetical protein